MCHLLNPYYIRSYNTNYYRDKVEFHFVNLSFFLQINSISTRHIVNF